MIGTLFTLALAGATVDAGNKVPDAPKQFTPEIRGQLLDGARPVSSNVCLRQSGSEIRMCGYTDNAGNFYIPPHSSRPVLGTTEPPTYWLEIGRVTEAKKIAPIEASPDTHASLALECNLSRSVVCDRTSARSVASRVSKGERAPHSTHPAK